MLVKVKSSREAVLAVVADNNKQRFSITRIEGSEYIRANQGHSISVPDLELKAITSIADLPKGEGSVEGVVVHGTYSAAWKSIRTEGLSKMGRNHVHFAVGTPEEGHVISGSRSNCQVFVYIDLEKALADGIAFFLSDNNVILSPGNAEGLILPKYFKAVLDASTREPFDEYFPIPL